MKFFSLFSLFSLFFVVSCSVFGTKNNSTQVPRNEESGTLSPTLPQDPAMPDPAVVLMDLPKIYTDRFPRDISIFVVQGHNAASKNGVFISYTPTCIQTHSQADLERMIGMIPNNIRPLFNAQNQSRHTIVGFKGTFNNIHGDTSHPLHSKLFTLLAGDQIMHLGYFNHPDKGVKLFSYDPINNELGDFEGGLATVATGSAVKPVNIFHYSINIIPDGGEQMVLYLNNRNI